MILSTFQSLVQAFNIVFHFDIGLFLFRVQNIVLSTFRTLVRAFDIVFHFDIGLFLFLFRGKHDVKRFFHTQHGQTSFRILRPALLHQLRHLNHDLKEKEINETLDTFLNKQTNTFFYLTTHSTHFIYGYMASDIWLRTILIVRGNPLPPHRLLLSIDSKGSFICTISQTG